MAQDPQTTTGVPGEVKERPSRPVGSSPNRAPEPFGKYILLQRIGAGGMAEVFQAIVGGPEGFQRSLVIKRMLPQLSQDEAFVRMFIDEAKLSGLLSHPNLVQIVEFGKVDDCFFIAMEYVHGRTLAAIKNKLHAGERLAPIAASVEIARQLCVGLDYAHSMQSPDGTPLGIVHRDISPPNVMLDFHGVVKILDFGIARVADGLRDSRTQVGMMKGKIAYMSPEQLKLGDIDRRSDVFAVGIILHEMLTGRRLFRSNTDYASSRMVLEMEIAEPSELNAAVPVELDRVVMRALQRDPDARYATAGALAADLERVMAELRYSPREHLTLLRELFPDAEANEKGMTITGNFSLSEQSQLSEDKPTSFGSHRDLPRSGLTTAPSLSARTPMREQSPGDAAQQAAAAARRKRLIAAAAGLVAGLIVLPLVLHFRGGNAERVASEAAPAPAAPAMRATPEVVRLSLDSTPQDATVVQVDTGRVLGHTPFTFALGHSTAAQTFRFEKTNHAPLLYKIIPDLDKSVRVELTPSAAPAVKPALALAPAPTRTAPRVAVAPAPTRAAPVRKGAKRVAPAAAPRAAGGAKDCLVTIGSFPWAELWIDGKDVGQPTPVVRLPISCGTHKLRFKRDNPEIDQVESISVTAGQELKKNFRLAGADIDG